MGTGSKLGVKHPELGVDRFIAMVKERVELYLYSPHWAFVACSRVKCTLILIEIHRENFNLGQN
jgi:hypothetical protein